jgi:lipopolysaccharide biosynthesis protein
LLFITFPFVFKCWAIYQNWNNAQIFNNHRLYFWQATFWQRKFFSEYKIPIESTPKKNPFLNGKTNLAIIIHAFYIEIFNEIIQQLSLSEFKGFALYVTAPVNIIKEIENSLQGVPFSYSVMAIENHGRDILPFLKILPLMINNDHDLVLKLHTKSSNHLNRKDHWRNDLFVKLIGGGKMNELLDILKNNPSIGMVGPVGNILPMRLFYGANGERVHRYSKMMGATDDQLADLNFVAGSMFYARTDALLPLLKLKLADEDFETEAGQTDGTMAHVVERLFSVGTILSGLQLADTNFSPSEPKLTVSKNHRFTL